MSEKRESGSPLIHRSAFVPERDAFGSEQFSWVAIDHLPHQYFDIDEDEFCRFYDSGVIWEWNRRYGTYLDSFEIGIYEGDLETMLKEVVEAIGEGTISNALRAAVYEGTGVYFSF